MCIFNKEPDAKVFVSVAGSVFWFCMYIWIIGRRAQIWWRL